MLSKKNRANKKDIEDIPKNVLKKLEMIPVKTMEDVFRLALAKPS